MVDPVVLSPDVLELEGHDLSDDGAKLAGCGGDAVGGGAVTSGEDLAGDDEAAQRQRGAARGERDSRGGVGPEVLEEVGEAVEEDEGGDRVGDESAVAEAHAGEGDGEHDESHELDGLAAPRVDEEERNPVARDETGDGEDDVSDRDVLESLPSLLSSRAGEGRTVSDTLEDDAGTGSAHAWRAGGGTYEELSPRP